MRLAAIATLLVVAGCPSKKNDERELQEALDQMIAFSDQMCACKDKACADKVQEGMTKWGEDMAKKATGTKRTPKPNDAQIKRLTEATEQYAKCMMKLVSEAPPSDRPPPANTLDADTILRSARDWIRAAKPGLLLTSAYIAYVDPTGAFDGTHGRLFMTFGRAPEGSADDPKRRTGAPVTPPPPRPDDCLSLSWEPTAGWSPSPGSCSDAIDVPMRCTVAQIWKRSLGQGAPDALATLSFSAPANPASWSFRIEDEPRNVHVAHDFVDDCEVAVER